MHFAWRVLPLYLLFTLIPSQAFSLETKYVELVMMLQERVPVASLAKAVLDPQSPHYELFYSPEDIRAISAPTDDEYAALLKSLTDKGGKIISQSPSHLVITVQMPKTEVEKMFGTELIVDSVTGRHFPASKPRMPKNLGLIASVSGLDTTHKMTPRFSIKKQSATHPMDDSPFDGLTPTYIKSVYGFDPIVKSGISGKGQHIAIAGYDGFNTMDVVTYFGTMIGSNPPKFDQVIFNGEPGPDEDSAAENELDIEFSGAIAPGAQIHAFFSEHNDDPGEVQIFTAILDDNRAKVANYSWGDCETHVSADHRADMERVFARAVAQGVTIVAAAGDWGSNGCEDNTTAVGDWPSANPYVMSIGGTTLWESGIFTHKLNEEAWEDTGGGYSTIWDAPDWQKGISPNGKRGFPDVSFNGDPNTGETAYLSYPAIPKWIVVGGTSIGAPQWSGFIALLNEARGARGPIGFLPPYIYGLTADQRAVSFRDIVKGKNGAFSAGPGWDPTTGFGSPLASVLLEQLVGL